MMIREMQRFIALTASAHLRTIRSVRVHVALAIIGVHVAISNVSVNRELPPTNVIRSIHRLSASLYANANFQINQSCG